MKYEDHVLLEFILTARRSVSAKEVLMHLKDNIDGYYQSGGKDGGLRNVQNRLKQIAESEHFDRLIRRIPDGRGHRYEAIKAAPDSEPAMSIEQACALLMSDKNLRELAPTRLFQTQGEYQELVSRAEDVVRKHHHGRHLHNNHLSDFLKRVAVMQRGQSLVAADVDENILEAIGSSIIQKRCVSLIYNGKKRVLHPYGLVFRQPKIYLLATDTKSLKSEGPDRVELRQYLCNRISGAQVSKEPHQVPDAFDVDEYVNEGRMEMLAYARKDRDSANRRFTLELRLRSQYSQNMIKDLMEYPLSENQDIEKERGTEDYILKARGMRATHSLVEWVMGRMSQVEVLEPASFRNHIKAQIDAMYRQYQS